MITIFHLMDYQNFQKDLNMCGMYARQIQEQFQADSTLKELGCVVQPQVSFCFRVQIPQNKFNVGFISCSIPPDANMGLSYLKRNVVYETALVDTNDKLMYNDYLDYNDVNRFDSPSEIISEIKRLVEETNR
jgi:hypothetical protein